MTQELEISGAVSRRRKGRPAPDVRPRDEAADFPPNPKDRDRSVVRPSRRERRGGKSRKGANRHGDYGSEKKAAATPEIFQERVILRRNPVGGVDPALVSLLTASEAAAAVAGLGLWDYDNQMRNLQRQREQYLMSRAAAAGASLYYPYVASSSPLLRGPGSGYLPWGGAAAVMSSRPESPASPGACEECEAAREEGRAASFHRCVYDAVTVAFRSPAGPIQRPTKKHVEASA